MKKKILFLALVFSVLVLSFMLSSCSKGTKGLEFVDINDDECGVKCGEAINETEIVIPKKHDGKKVTTIIKSGFSGCENLKSITIPKTVTKMEMGAFFNCSKLENVYYKGKINQWCNIEFEHSTANPMLYAENFYLKNKEKTELEIGDTDIIRAYAFFGFDNLTSVVIEDSVLAIESSAFAGCINLSSVRLPSNLEYMDKLIFSSCTSLTSITIPSGVTIIHPNAFMGCELTSVAFENTEGWYKAVKEESTSGEAIDVTDSKANASAINIKTHVEFWKRKVDTTK